MTTRELGETRTQRLERFALRGAYAEKELHETKQALAAMTQRAEQAEAAALVKGNEWAQAIQHATAFRERAEQAEAERDAMAATVAKLTQANVELAGCIADLTETVAAVPVSAIAWLMADITPADDGDMQRQYESRAAVLAWLEQQEAQP